MLSTLCLCGSSRVVLGYHFIVASDAKATFGRCQYLLY